VWTMKLEDKPVTNQEFYDEGYSDGEKEGKRSGFGAGISLALGVLYTLADNEEAVAQFVQGIHRSAAVFVKEHE
jgi:hypothetical protein